MVLDVNRGDVLQDSRLSSRKAGLCGTTEFQGILGDRQSPSVLQEVKRAGLPVGALDCQPGVRLDFQERLGLAQVLQALVRSHRAHQGLAHVVPDAGLERCRQQALQKWYPERDRLVELVLQAERLEVLHSSVRKAALARRPICRGSSEEMLDWPACTAGNDLERSHR